MVFQIITNVQDIKWFEKNPPLGKYSNNCVKVE
jgi:hypothetical protein